MPNIHKEIHVHIPCPACGKTERVKLKWAEKHKSMKCGGCKQKVDLKANPARSLIARASELVTAFEKALDALHAEAKRDARSFKAKKKPAKKIKSKQKAKPRKQAAKKRSRRKASAVMPLLPGPGIGAEFTV